MLQTQRPLRAFALAWLVLFALAAAATAADSPSLVGVVNVNTASSEELQLLPGIGASRADALIALRKQRGGFKSIDELKDVKGIGDTGLAKMRPYVRLQGKTTARLP